MNDSFLIDGSRTPAAMERDDRQPHDVRQRESRALETVFNLQNDYLERMQSLFDPRATANTDFDRTLSMVRRHRHEHGILASWNRIGRTETGRGIGGWRIRSTDEPHIAMGNPCRLVLEARVLNFASPLHGLHRAACGILMTAKPPARPVIMELLSGIYHGLLAATPANDDHMTNLRLAARYLARDLEVPDWTAFNEQRLLFPSRPQCSLVLRHLLHAITTERNHGSDPFCEHGHFYDIAAEAACAGLDGADFDHHLRLLAETRFPDLTGFIALSTH